MPLPPDLLAQLQARGIIPPSAPAQNLPAANIAAGGAPVDPTTQALSPWAQRVVAANALTDASPAPEQRPVAAADARDEAALAAEQRAAAREWAPAFRKIGPEEKKSVDNAALERAQEGEVVARLRENERPGEGGPERPEGFYGGDTGRPRAGVFARPGEGGAGGIPSLGAIPGGGGGAASVVPAHAVPLVSPENRAAILGGAADQAQGAQELAAAQVGANEASADALHRQAASVALEDVEQRAQERERKRVLTGEFAQLKSLNDEAAAGKIDPDRWWGSRGGGQQARALVGLFLGQLGQGLMGQGGPSAALGILNKHIDDDIAAQREGLASKRDAAAAQRSLLGQKMAAFGDDRAAEAAARVTRLEQYRLLIDSEAKRAQSPVIAAQARMASGAIRQEQGKLAASLEQWRPATAVAAGPSGPTPAQIAAETSKIYESSKGSVPPDQARRIAIYNLTGRDYGSGPLPSGWGDEKGAAGDVGARLAAIEPSVRSTAYDPTRAFQGTSAFRDQLAQERWNAQIKAAIHARFGARSPEAMDSIGKNYMIEPGDIPSTVRQKMANARTDLGGASAPDVSQLQTPAGSE